MNDAEPGEARFDSSLRAWILSSHADVAAGLRDPRLSPSGAGAEEQPAHTSVREAARRTLTPERMAAWRVGMKHSAQCLAESLPADRTIDLVAAFAGPWSIELAMRVTGAVPSEVPRLTALAREVFVAAAFATDRESQAVALAATADLARSLSGSDPTIAVQTFVALSQTLPCLLASVWHQLFRRPELASLMRAQPDLAPQAVEELLRLASPARAVFRQAVERLAIGEARIVPGDRVILMLAAANHDPAQFPKPGEIDLSRSSRGHLAFGRGTHSCSGASLVRMAVTVATVALLETARNVEVMSGLEWFDGFAIRAPASLPVVLRRHIVTLTSHAGTWPDQRN